MPLPIVPAESLEERIVAGLAHIVTAGKHASAHAAREHELSTLQASALAVLQRAPLRLGALAGALGVTSPTVSDAVRVLVDKKLVRKHPDPDDARAVRIELTAVGRRAAVQAGEWHGIFASAIEGLDGSQKEVLLTSLLKVITHLQSSGVLTDARTCTGCRYFAPDVHSGAQPHHCGLVDAPFGAAELQTDCADHEGS